MVSSHDGNVKTADEVSAVFLFGFFSLFFLLHQLGPEAVKVTWIRFWNLTFASGDVGLCLLKLTNEIIVRAVIEFLKQFVYLMFSRHNNHPKYDCYYLVTIIAPKMGILKTNVTRW